MDEALQDAILSLERGDEGLIVSVVRRSGEVEDVYLTTERICASPFCPCTALTLTLRPISDCARARWGERDAIDVDLDPFEQRYDAGRAGRSSRDEREFGRWLALHLQDAHWASLRERFLRGKAEVMRVFDPERGVTAFPFDEIEDDGLMVAYHEVLPFGETIDLGHDGELFRIDDQYCVRSGCTCSNALLAFVPIRAAGGRSRVQALSLDYAQMRWTNQRTGKPPSGKALRLAKTLEARDEILRRVRDRHALLRSIYRASSAARIQAPNPPSGDKPGRNVPCPCGSGKKFKRCCGNEVE